MWYGGIYRLPPKPQRARPSATLPAEVFPDPPVGNRGRSIVMAIVAAQWIFVPQPQQRRPTVTEGVVPAVLVPQSRVQDRLIVESWRVVPVPQRSKPTAILPAEVFPDPPVENRGRRAVMQTVADSWRRGPQAQQRPPRVTAGVEVFVPYSPDRIAVSLSQPVLPPQHRPARALLPAEAFPDPPVGQQRRRVVDRLVGEGWQRLPLPRQRPPTVTEGAAVVVPFIPVGRREDQAVRRWWELAEWHPAQSHDPVAAWTGTAAALGWQPVKLSVELRRLVYGLWDAIQWHPAQRHPPGAAYTPTPAHTVAPGGRTIDPAARTLTVAPGGRTITVTLAARDITIKPQHP